MIYLSPSEYELYGLDATTSEGWANAASVLIEAHCRRPSLGVEQYTERLRVLADRTRVRLTYLPLTSVAPNTTPFVSARARYAQPRRGESVDGGYAFEIAQAFALPGMWTALDVQALDYCVQTGEVTLPCNALGLGFNEVEVTYNAGLAVIPDALKSACAQVMRNAVNTPALNLRAGTLDRMRLEYFADSLLDSDVRALLSPYVAQKVAS